MSLEDSRWVYLVGLATLLARVGSSVSSLQHEKVREEKRRSKNNIVSYFEVLILVKVVLDYTFAT
jgi:hypothetical protein